MKKSVSFILLFVLVNIALLKAQNGSGYGIKSSEQENITVHKCFTAELINTLLHKPSQAILTTNQETQTVENLDGSAQITERFDNLELRGDPIVISSKNIRLYAGKSYRIDFNLEKREDISAFQFTLEVIDRSVEIQSVIPGKIVNFSEQNYALFAKDNLLTVTWDNPEQNALPAKSVLFTLIINVQFDVNLVDAFKLSSKVTTSLGYNSKGEKVPVNLNIDGDVNNPLPLHFTVGPNPVQSQLYVNLILPEESHLKMNLIDFNGRIFPAVVDKMLDAGNQSFDLDLGHYPNGVYYLQMELGGVLQPLQKLMIYR